MKLLTMSLITAQTHLGPARMRLAMFGLVLLLSAATGGSGSLDDFSIGGCGGG
ncbi:MAG TPA: hypothetical protein VMN57_03345 [Anaerolineales bacterium]|nr:hypothetical protein [Anaerolineales bacterium]